MRIPTSIHPIFVVLLGAISLSGAACADLDPCKRGTEGCACIAPNAVGAPGTCDASMVCAAGTCFLPEPTNGATVCYDTCGYRQNGDCDDGGEGSAFDDCALGGDCTDCGVRENPCTNPSQPVFCPQTPTNCWPSNTDCHSVRHCPAESTPLGCSAGLFVDCSRAMNDRCVTSAKPCSTNPAAALCVVEDTCVQFGAICNSLTTCAGATSAAACFFGEAVVCQAGGGATCM